MKTNKNVGKSGKLFSRESKPSAKENISTKPDVVKAVKWTPSGGPKKVSSKLKVTKSGK
jgi:hypothetical protein